MRIGTIYIIKNSINKSVYIGQTSQPLDTRWGQHLADVGRSSSAIHLAMSKYGSEYFWIEALETCEVSLLNEREIFWIAHFDSFNCGYNSTIGGDGSSNVMEDEALNILHQWNHGSSASAIGHHMGRDHNVILRVLRQYGVSEDEIGKHNSGRSVVKICPITHEILEIFSSSLEAGKSVNVVKTAIHNACRDNSSSSGFFWKYLDEICADDLSNKIYSGALPAVYGKGSNTLSTIDRSAILDLWKCGKTQKEIADTLNCSRETVRYSLIELGISQKERDLRGGQESVVRIDPDTKEIMEFSSCAEAGRYMGVDQSAIVKARTNYHKSVGFFWITRSLVSDEDISQGYYTGILVDKAQSNIESQGHAVLQFNMNNKLVGEYYAINVAARAVNGTSKSITSNIHKGRPYRGFYWRYKSKYLEDCETYFRNRLNSEDYSIEKLKILASEMEIPFDCDIPVIKEKIIHDLLKRVLILT